VISVSSSFQWLGDKVLGAVLGDLDRRMMDAGNRGLAVMQALAPRKTGFLASQESFQVVNHTLVFRFGAPYDIYQEFGTRTIRPHPHIRPGLQAIGNTLGFNLEMQFNAPGAGTWQGLYAHQGSFIAPSGIQPRPLTRAQHEHVRRHLMPTSKRLHRGNVKKARMVVRRFD
jgi:hypothetical protein